MSQLVWLEGKHTSQSAHCALVGIVSLQLDNVLPFMTKIPSLCACFCRPSGCCEPGRSSWSCGYPPGTRPGSSGSCWSSGLCESVWLGGSGWYGVWGQAGLILGIFLLFELIQKYFQIVFDYPKKFDDPKSLIV